MWMRRTPWAWPEAPGGHNTSKTEMSNGLNIGAARRRAASIISAPEPAYRHRV
jgi:hypothetical protein